MISSIIQALFFIKIQPNMNEQEKKQQRIYDLFNTKTKPKFLLLPWTKQKKIFLQKKAGEGLLYCLFLKPHCFYI